MIKSPAVKISIHCVKYFSGFEHQHIDQAKLEQKDTFMQIILCVHYMSWNQM